MLQQQDAAEAFFPLDGRAWIVMGVMGVDYTRPSARCVGYFWSHDWQRKSGSQDASTWLADAEQSAQWELQKSAPSGSSNTPMCEMSLVLEGLGLRSEFLAVVSITSSTSVGNTSASDAVGDATVLTWSRFADNLVGRDAGLVVGEAAAAVSLSRRGFPRILRDRPRGVGAAAFAWAPFESLRAFRGDVLASRINTIIR
jgi:hypothetical protein